MADYQVSIDGKVKRKKKKQSPAFKVGFDGKIIKATAFQDDEGNDIAPVKKKDDSKIDFFQKGAFEDGYQAGDATKAILGTLGDAGVGIVKGGASLGEGIADLARYGVAGVADAVGKDDYAEKVRKKAQKNSVENFFKGTDDYLDQYSILGRTSDAVMQGLGQVGGIILTGGVAGALGAGGAATTAITSGVMGLSSAGSGMSEAYQSGATDEEAAVYGISSGVIDAGTEMLFGGLGKAVNALGLSRGISSLDDAFAKKISSKISNQVAKNFAEFGVKASAEGFEEVLAGLGSAITKKLTYMDEKELGELVKDENLLEQFVVGTATSSMMQSGYIPKTSQGSLKESNKTGRDFITGYTQNEQSVIDKEVEKRIKKQEESGKKLNNKEIGKIKEQVEKDLEKGYIDIDTIESVLGGETYNQLKSVTDNETKLQEEYDSMKDEYDTLNKMKLGEMTGEQTDRKAELKNKLEELKENLKNSTENSNKTQLRTQLDSEMSKIVEGTKLSESYNEKARREQELEIDVESYKNESAKQTAQNFKDFGANNTNASHDYLDLVTKVAEDRGQTFKFMTTKQLEEAIAKGEYNVPEDSSKVEAFIDKGKNEIIINMDAKKSLNSLVGHEITHTLEGDKTSYDSLQKTLFTLAETRGEYDARWESIQRRYSKEKGYTEEQQLQELTSDLVGDYIFGNSDFIANLSTENPNIFKKIYNEIKYLWKMATAGSKEQRQLETAKKKFEDAWRKANASNASLNTDASVKLFVSEEIENVSDRLSGREWNQVKSAVADYSKLNYHYEKSSNGDIIIPVNNKLVYTDANFDSPGISKIIEINSDIENEIDEARSWIYGAEKGEYSLTDAYEFIESIAGNEIINEYKQKSSSNAKGYDRRTGRGKSRSDSYHSSFLQERIRRANEIINSVNNEQTSSEDGVFFDGENGDVRFSLADTVEETLADSTPSKEYGNHIYAKDVVLDIPTKESLMGQEESLPIRSDYAPLTAEEAERRDAERKEAVAPAQQSVAAEDTSKTLTRSELHGNIIKNVKSVFVSNGFDFDSVLSKAKNLATFATVDNTPQRVMEKALGYKQGQVLSDLTVNKVAQNETEGIRWLNSFTDRKNGLLAQISKQYHIKPGSKESAAAQMYAEGFYVSEHNEIIKYGDAELAKDFPNQRVRENIKALAKDERIRQIYDDTLARINESRTRNAYPEIPRLDNYFLHFRAMDDTFSRLGLPFNPNDIRAKDLPTDLNGVTADLKPGQPYFASAMHRTGKRTSFDLLGGLERYLTSAKNQIYHIDDIQTFRALRNYIADTYGQANGLEGLDTLSEEEAQSRIEQVYSSHLSTFAKFLNEEANVLAGKTALIDRGLEGIIGRRGITFLNTVNGQVGSNMVGWNLSSSLTNVLPVVQTFAKSNKFDFVKAFAQTVSNKIGLLYGKADGFAEQSPVMIRRKGADRFYRTPFQKVGDTGYLLMSAIDGFSTELIARAKYNELTRKGMDSQKAHYETDKWVSRLMGDRSLGQMPQLYNSKMLGLITKFQLEVRNQLDSQFYDTIQEAKVSNEHIRNGLAKNAKTAAKVASTFAQLAVAQHLFGTLFETIAGYNPAFDIIEVLLKTIGYDDDEESEDTVLDNVEQGFLMLLEDLPYTSTLTGGRIPIASALPIEEFITGVDEYGNEKSRLETLGENAPYYALPTGYGQIKKSVQGLKMFDDDLPTSGSYTDSGNLRFPVEDTPINRLQAGVFGQWASDAAGDYFDNERKPLNEKQIEEFKEVDIPIRDYWEYREGLSGLKTLSEKGDYIRSLDLPIDKKNILINNIADRKTPIDFAFDSDKYENFEEFDFATRYPEKYEILKDQGISVKDYKEKEQETAFIYTDVYSNMAKNPEKYTISKVISDDVKVYKQYTSELNSIKADKDANGKTITGSAKKKKTEYINSLDLDYGQRIILYRSLFDSNADKNTYNPQIVEYLDSRDDITPEEMQAILESLDMKVHSDGRITW